MDYLKANYKRRTINPEEKTNLFLTFFFVHTRKLFLDGFKKELNEDDIYEVLPSYQSQKLGNQLEKHWDKQQKPSVFLLLWRCFGKLYLIIIFSQLIPITITILRLKVLKNFLSYFTTDHNNFTRVEVSFLGASFVIIKFVETVYRNNFRLSLAALGIKMRSALTSLIFRKVLKINSSQLDIPVGKIISLITRDVNEFDSYVTFSTLLWCYLLQFLMTCYAIYTEVGSLVLIIVIIACIIILIQVLLAKLLASFKLETLKKTDQRYQVTKEMLDAITVIKIFNWGDCYKKKMSKTRKEEVSLIYKVYLLLVAKFTLSDFILNAATYAFIIGSLWFGKQIKIETMFFLIHSLNVLSAPLKIIIPRGMHEVIKLFVVIRRIEQFLKTPNVQLPSKCDHKNENLVNITLTNLDVYVKKQKMFENVNLVICNGLNVVTGPIGSGKSVLMQILLQEYQIARGSVTITSRISYASEQPWLFPSTIKQNILFGANYDKHRYLKVLEVCALLPDLQHLQGGDCLIVADRGSNLSKGQQCRINLARAVYRESEIYLLDGCLSNLDVLVADYIFEKCIKQFLNDKLVIQVTQHPRHISRADSVIILSNHTAKLAPVAPGTFPPELYNSINQKESEKKITEQEEEDEAHETMNLLAETEFDKNIYQETVEGGTTKFQKYVAYVQKGGGLILFFVVCMVFVLAQFSKTGMHKLENNWLKTEQQIQNYETYNNSEKENYEKAIQERSKMIYLLPLILVIVGLTTFLKGTIFFRLATNASMNFHRSLATNVIDASMEFFRIHYVGNILNRFSEDLLYLDEIVPYSMYYFLNGFVEVVGIAIFLGTFSKTFLLVALALCLLPLLTAIYTLRTGRALKRLELSSRSSLVGRVSATPEGLPIIRSANMQNTIIKEFDRHLDLYTSASYLYLCWLRTVIFLEQLYFVVFTMILVIVVLIIDEDISAAHVGLILTQLTIFQNAFDKALLTSVKIEVELTAAERILEYTRQKLEYKGGSAVEHWPQQHQIKFDNVSLSYNREDFVLRDLSFTVEPQETVAIVGRTAAGKSSIISTILRLHKFEGKILIDGVDITTLPLDTLRANISVISQDPVLFTGTVRENIDLTGKYTDDEIWNALRVVNLDELFPNLDHRISGADLNLSLGQKQLLCLARAMICNNKIVIIDEATANVDKMTERMIHNIVQNEFATCTVILITHKLDYVLDYDKVMVLDGGSIIEFDRPSVLLNKQGGLFYRMYKKVR